LGPAFGFDIYVSDYSSQNYYGYSIFGSSYQLPKNITYGYIADGYLAGTNGWQPTEIEVYQVTLFEPYSVTFLHNGCII
jgi:hypothetical protein